MATLAGESFLEQHRRDVLSGTPRARFIDRWIFAFMAAWFIAIVLTGFIPDSLMNLAMIKAHQRAPYPLITDVHAVLMGSFMLLLLAQTVLVATGRTAIHRRIGLLGMVLAPALVIVGILVAATNYHTIWQGAHFGPPPVRVALTPVVALFENILLLQLRMGILFSLFLALSLWARTRDPGFHKRMMILGTAVPLAVALARITWLPEDPHSTLLLDAYVLFAVSPMLVWDIVRNRSLHRAYWVWLPIYIGTGLAANSVWDTPWWHATARHIMGV